MIDNNHSQALSFVAQLAEEPHDGLTDLSAKLGSSGQNADFWWREYPVVFVSDPPKSHWPILAVQGSTVTISKDDKKAISVPKDAIRTFMREKVDNKALSEAEFSLMIDLCAGLSIGDSARAADLAVETRRKQLKSAFRKLQTGGQAESISLIARLLNEFSAELTASFSIDSTGWDSYTQFLPKGVRYGTIQHAKNPVRYLDIGPPDGRPVLVLHPMLFPHLDDVDVALFHELGWRTLWPVRPGCLEGPRHAQQGWHAHCRQAVEGIRAVHDMAGGAPAPIIALVSSAAYAAAYSEDAKDRVSRIDFIATCFSAGRHRLSNLYPLDGVLRLLHQNSRVALATIQHLAASLSKRERFEAAARLIFGDCAPDVAQLELDFGTQFRAERFRHAVSHSIDTMRLDYMSQIHFSWRRAAALPMRKQFWHGSDDGVHNFNHLVALSETVTPLPPRIFSGVGHHVQGHPLHKLLREVAKTYPN